MGFMFITPHLAGATTATHVLTSKRPSLAFEGYPVGFATEKAQAGSYYGPYGTLAARNEVPEISECQLYREGRLYLSIMTDTAMAQNDLLLFQFPTQGISYDGSQAGDFVVYDYKGQKRNLWIYRDTLVRLQPQGTETLFSVVTQ